MGLDHVVSPDVWDLKGSSLNMFLQVCRIGVGLDQVVFLGEGEMIRV